MILSTPHSRSKDFIKAFESLVENPNWGRACWDKVKQRLMLKEIQALNPDTVTPDEIASIMETSYYTAAPTCDSCNTGFDAMLYIPINSHEFPGTYLCQGCVSFGNNLFTGL